MQKESNNMDENKEKKEYEILKWLNEVLTDFKTDGKNAKKKDDSEER